MTQDADLRAVAALDDEVRRSLYRFVRRQGRPVTREEAARGVRISVRLAAFHLDKLVERGLLHTDSAPPAGARRRVGRAPKRYAPSDLQVSVSLPERRYQLMAEVLVDAAADGRSGETPSDTARRVASQRGRRLGADVRAARRLGRPGPERTLAVAEDVLDQFGYEPAADPEQGLELRNCPFHGLVERAPALVCSLNAAFVDGLLRGFGNDSVVAALEPRQGSCCVRVRPPER